MTLRYACLMAIVTASLFSCKTGKDQIVQVTPRSISEVLDSLSTDTLSYDFFYGKAKMKYNGEESKIGGRMTIMMVPDSVIWMVFKKLSIEGARVLIRPDSTWVLYRQEDLYEANPTQAYFDSFSTNLGFSDLQKMMIGHYPLPKEEDVQIYQESDNYLLEWQGQLGRMRYLIDEELNISQIYINDGQDRTFVMNISDHNEAGFGQRRDIKITDADASVSEISIKFSSITFDEPRSIKFDIPDHYRKYP